MCQRGTFQGGDAVPRRAPFFGGLREDDNMKLNKGCQAMGMTSGDVEISAVCGYMETCGCSKETIKGWGSVWPDPKREKL